MNDVVDVVDVVDDDVEVSVVTTFSDDLSSSCTPLEVSFETEDEYEDDEFVFKLLTRRVKKPLLDDV